jgi:GLPGLI family protein
MKLQILTTIALLISTLSYSQNYKATYFSTHDLQHSNLVFNNKSWLYTTEGYAKTSVQISGTFRENTQGTDSVKISLFNYRSLPANLALDQEMNNVVKDTLQKPDWVVVSDSMKTIGDYQCVMATAKVRGRNYTVWFAPEIAVTAGPWKLWGLPGLIVNAVADDGNIEFILTSLKPSDTELKAPSVKHTVSPEEFKSIWKKSLRTMRAMFSDENLEISNLNVKINSPDKELYE